MQTLRSGSPASRLADAGAVVMGKEPVRAGQDVAGYVTSAGYGYSVGESLAYAWLPETLAQPGTEVVIEYFGQDVPATVVTEPRWDPQGERVRT